MNMNMTTRLFQRLVSWIAILAGVVAVYWGGVAELFPGPVFAPATVAWGKQLLVELCQHLWLPAVGVLLLVIGLFPAIAKQTKRNRVAQFGVGLVGFGLIVSGGLVLKIPSVDLGEVGYLLPLFVAGILLVGLVLPD